MLLTVILVVGCVKATVSSPIDTTESAKAPVSSSNTTTSANSVTTDSGTVQSEQKDSIEPTPTTAASSTSSTTPAGNSGSLTKDLCSDPNSPPKGTFTSISLSGILYPKDEGTNVTFICEMMEKPEECKPFINELANSTQLYLSDGQMIEYISREYEVGDKITIKFEFSLNHTQHHRKKCFCRTTAENGLILNSTEKHFNTIGAHWPVFMSPRSIYTEIGSSFQLTCMTNHSEATEYIVWYRKKNEVGASYSRRLFSGNSYSDGNVIIDSGDKMSILTMTQTQEWEGIFKCETKEHHSNPPYATASVQVKSKDEKVQNASTIAGCSVAAAIALIIVVFVLRKRALKKKIKIAKMLMDVQEQHGNTHQAAANTTLLNADEPASNCYSIEGLNLGIEALGVETLTETFMRLTSKWNSWQIDRSRLEIMSILGEGNFGSVYLGSLQDQYVTEASIQVAVKTIKASRLDKQAITEFEKEISVMTALQHDNIVSLIGLCTEAMPLNIIMEYMKNGPLNTFLMEKAPDKLQDTELTTKDLLYMGIQPCDALEYLNNKSIVHRDISARNCLVGENFIVKLADFGLSRGTMDEGKNYYKKDGGMVPVKWMSPEALTFGKYTSSSDVWACAVLLWEIFSFGAVPYQGYSNQQVIVFVNEGGRLEKPSHCPEAIWKYISMCWVKAPEDRITIGGLSSMLKGELNSFS